MDDISDENFLDTYMCGLREYITHDIFIKNPRNIKEAREFSQYIQENNKDR
jgi:hypothetical protein